jgi:hypothetical protein
MFTRVALTTIMAAGLCAIPTAQTAANEPVASTTADQRTDDPIPCPDCPPGRSALIIIASADMRTDDPIPCPDCPPGRA